MLTELLVLLVVLLISVQASSLWSSLLVVPTSVLTVLDFSPSVASNLISFIFILVFIGGLMVLLVSVASAIHQEQAASISATLWSITGLLFVLYLMAGNPQDWAAIQTTFFYWLSYSSILISTLMFLFILLSLLIMSCLILEFKGITRNL